MSNAIRLTNKTAIALRKSAVHMRRMYFACAVVISAVMAVLAVYLGLKWLPAVPLTVFSAVIIDVWIVIHGNSAYLSLIGQAICTEAAARDIRTGMSESARREKAITDLINVKADAQRAQQKKPARSGQPFSEPEKAEKAEEKKADDEPDGMQEKHMPHRRRRSDGLKLIRSEQAK